MYTMWCIPLGWVIRISQRFQDLIYYFNSELQKVQFRERILRITENTTMNSFLRLIQGKKQ